MAGWGTFLGGLMDKLPIQGRTERWKNRVDTLQKEKHELLKGEWTLKKGKRLTAIESELDELNRLLKNKVG